MSNIKPARLWMASATAGGPAPFFYGGGQIFNLQVYVLQTLISLLYITKKKYQWMKIALKKTFLSFV